MKKLKLNLKNAGEVLSRNQMKQVVGGYGSGHGDYLGSCKNQGGTWFSDSLEACEEVASWACSSGATCTYVGD